jgi:hypothetical protein
MSRCGSGDRPGCKKEIWWGQTPEGKKVPLDMTAPVYRVISFDSVSGLYAVEQVTGYKVTHFATCPVANNFSSSSKKQEHP